ncbi:MAG: hypothetical protein ACXW39_06495, partial [Nitrospira sp.]
NRKEESQKNADHGPPFYEGHRKQSGHAFHEWSKTLRRGISLPGLSVTFNCKILAEIAGAEAAASRHMKKVGQIK